ncbi:MAG: hypothetical protein JNL60_01910 [Bacteroidia bacterium]|nr:hypothetical protein [Bacteroidia bacterium]
MNKAKFLLVIVMLGLLFFKIDAQCPPTKAANLTFSPNKTVYCVGDNVTITFSSPNQIQSLNWSYSSGGPSYTTAMTVFQITNMTYPGGVLNVSGTLKGQPFGTCNFNMSSPPMNIIVSMPMQVNAGSDAIISGNPNYATLGASPVVISGGTSPYTYAWTPNIGFVNSTNASSQNPDVNPSATTNYMVTVTDAAGCQKTDNAMVYNAMSIATNKFYGILKKELDAGYYNSVNNGSTNTLYFKFDEEYYAPSGTNLDYRIYNDAGTQVSTTPSLVETIGDNRFSLNVASLSQGFYKLYVYNQKKEVWQTRFKVN